MNSSDEKIKIVFNYSGNKVLLQENKETAFSDLSKKFCSQAGIQNKVPIYYLGSQIIESTDNHTLSQLNIFNNLEISVLLPPEDKEEYLNIIFANSDGIKFPIRARKDTKFCDLKERYLMKFGIDEYKQMYFIFDSCSIKPNETRTLKELNLYDNSKIYVYISDGIIG